MAELEDLHTGADVYSSDGHKLGELHRIVLRRSDLAATHIVVDIGFLRSGHKLWEGGLGLDYDRVVPIDAVASASDERIDLNLSATQFKDAPEYTIESFEHLHPPPALDDASISERERVLRDRAVETGTYLVQRFVEPVGAVDVAEGSAVWRQEPHEKLGEIDRVLLDSAGRAEAFVLKRGLLKPHVVLPVGYVTELLDDIVRVQLSDAEIEALAEFQD